MNEAPKKSSLTQAEEALSASENELRALFAAMTDAVFVLDGAGRFLRIAPTNPINLSLPPEEMLGKTVHEILPKEQADSMIAKIGEAIRTNQPVPGEYAQQINGKEIWFASSTSRLSENSVIWVAHDITEHKRAEDKLREQAALLDLAQDAILVRNMQNEIVFWNNGAALTYGWTSIKAFGKLSHKLLQTVFPETREAVEQALLHEGTWEGELIHTRKDGKQITVASRQALQRDERGHPIGILEVDRDISERKQAEEMIRQLNATLEERVEERTRALQEAQEKLVRQERLAVLGQMAGSVGHELRNPLAAINNCVYYLKMVQPDASDKVREYHERIEQQVHIADKIIGDLLDFARVKSVEREPVTIPELVQRVLGALPGPQVHHDRARPAG